MSSINDGIGDLQAVLNESPAKKWEEESPYLGDDDTVSQEDDSVADIREIHSDLYNLRSNRRDCEIAKGELKRFFKTFPVSYGGREVEVPASEFVSLVYFLNKSSLQAESQVQFRVFFDVLNKINTYGNKTIFISSADSQTLVHFWKELYLYLNGIESQISSEITGKRASLSQLNASLAKGVEDDVEDEIIPGDVVRGTRKRMILDHGDHSSLGKFHVPMRGMPALPHKLRQRKEGWAVHAVRPENAVYRGNGRFDDRLLEIFKDRIAHVIRVGTPPQIFAEINGVRKFVGNRGITLLGLESMVSKGSTCLVPQKEKESFCELAKNLLALNGCELLEDGSVFAGSKQVASVISLPAGTSLAKKFKGKSVNKVMVSPCVSSEELSQGTLDATLKSVPKAWRLISDKGLMFNLAEKVMESSLFREKIEDLNLLAGRKSFAEAFYSLTGKKKRGKKLAKLLLADPKALLFLSSAEEMMEQHSKNNPSHHSKTRGFSRDERAPYWRVSPEMKH